MLVRFVMATIVAAAFGFAVSQESECESCVMVVEFCDEAIEQDVIAEPIEEANDEAYVEPYDAPHVQEEPIERVDRYGTAERYWRFHYGLIEGIGEVMSCTELNPYRQEDLHGPGFPRIWVFGADNSRREGGIIGTERIYINKETISIEGVIRELNYLQIWVNGELVGHRCPACALGLRHQAGVDLFMTEDFDLIIGENRIELIGIFFVRHLEPARQILNCTSRVIYIIRNY